ncbi:hypothetical protein C4577_04220 [Candidatus Parcubacteria bacterium]|nr:MAG: hypothetical protein C4577_04220 [Candidatus Parcubacteria bacterium]
MNKINKFFQKLYLYCLYIGLFGIVLIVGGFLFCNPLYQIGFGCLVIGMMAAFLKVALKNLGDK